MPHIVRSLITGLLLTYAECLLLWVWLYGMDNGFVWKTALWFGSHTILAVLINVMFYMIRLYRFAVSLQKEKKSDSFVSSTNNEVSYSAHVVRDRDSPRKRRSPQSGVWRFGRR